MRVPSLTAAGGHGYQELQEWLVDRARYRCQRERGYEEAWRGKDQAQQWVKAVLEAARAKIGDFFDRYCGVELVH
ncbi:hypothetical protein LshimejAT787_0410010 [Lyophyllum shimeji]|uniref:Uncharacterized protein n=1 Tax=Lyophyllum shimeji TaxID=47721 RepID=A0A9P3PKI0_LYOSH|nr:hypothetical protein LshimejAT787_0410010 [Lyophyllum shimeji]